MSDYHAQGMSPVGNVYALPNCEISLYATGEDNTLGALLWSAQQVQTLRVRESFVEVEHWATGLPYPEVRHVGERHELEFEAVWNVAAAMSKNVEHVLAVTWKNATLSGTGSSWVRRFYNGVTTSGRDIGSLDGNEFTSSNALRAKYYTEATHTTTPPVLSAGSSTV